MLVPLGFPLGTPPSVFQFVPFIQMAAVVRPPASTASDTIVLPSREIAGPAPTLPMSTTPPAAVQRNAGPKDDRVPTTTLPSPEMPVT